MRTLLPLSVLLLFSLDPTAAEPLQKDSTLEARKDSILSLYEDLRKSESDSARDSIGSSLDRSVRRLLEHDGIFSERLPKLGERIGILYAPDRSFRLFNWNVAYSDGTHEYFAYILHNPTSDKEKGLIRLEERRERSKRNKKRGGGIRKRDLERMDLDPGEWSPALYYEIIKKERNGETFYTLLGWEGKDALTTRKLIEPLRFNEKGIPHFGLPVFKTESEKEEDEIVTWREREAARERRVRKGRADREPRPKQRIIFEFTNGAVMTLKYEKKKDRIVFNQLVPKRPDLKGMYEFYGPDLLFNAYVWKDAGHWSFQKKVKPENEIGEDHPWNDPQEEE